MAEPWSEVGPCCRCKKKQKQNNPCLPVKIGIFSFRDLCVLLKGWLDNSQRSNPALLARSCFKSGIMGVSSVIHGPDVTVRDQRAKITEPGVRRAVEEGAGGFPALKEDPGMLCLSLALCCVRGVGFQPCRCMPDVCH